MKKIMIFGGVALLLFALIAQPVSSASWVKEIVGGLGYGAERIIGFVQELLPT
ncbi:hypothetical protein [Kutzneria sp. NPDC051319]|jgi:hypothetical protein|uniref:hypothetical protein n=1 Tax=Kutzneria sp. NPDC051319 TaxID=3155047 RepID=UPI003422EA7A